MIFPDVPPVVDFRKMPCAAVPAAVPAFRSTLMAAASASELGSGPVLTCEILSVPWPVSWPLTSAALKAVLAETTFRAALLGPPSAARLKTATWSPGVMEVDLALMATPLVTATEIGALEALAGAAAPPVAAAMVEARQLQGMPPMMPSRRRRDTYLYMGRLLHVGRPGRPGGCPGATTVCGTTKA